MNKKIQQTMSQTRRSHSRKNERFAIQYDSRTIYIHILQLVENSQPMFTNQQDQQGKPKDGTPPMFAPGLFSGASSGNLFGMNKDSGAPKFGGGASFSGGMFGNPSGRPSLVQLGLFPGKDTPDANTNNAPTPPVPADPRTYGVGKRSRTFEAKPAQQDTPPEVRQFAQRNNAPILGTTQTKPSIFSNVSTQPTGGIFNFANFANKTPGATGTGFLGFGQTTTKMEAKKQEATVPVQPPKNEPPKATPAPQAKSVFSGPLFASINMELMKANTNNLQNSISLGSNSQQSGESKPEVREPKGGLFSNTRAQMPTSGFFGNLQPVAETPIDNQSASEIAPTQVKQNIQPQSGTGLRFNTGLFDQKNTIPPGPTETQIPKLNLSPNIPNLFSNKAHSPSMFSNSFQKPKTDSVQGQSINEFSSGEENKKSVQKKEENKPMLFSGNSFANVYKQQQRPTPQEDNIVAPVVLKKVAPLFPPHTAPINQFKQTELPKPYQAPTENTDQPKLNAGSQQPNLASKNDKLLFSFMKTQNPTISTQPTKTATLNTGGQRSSIDSSKITDSLVYTDNRREDAPNKMAETLPKQTERPFYSVVRPKNVSNVNLFDLKTLQLQQKSQNFKAFLSAKHKQIVNSLKLNFTVRSTKFLNHAAEIQNQRQIFYVDLTNLLMRLLSLEDRSFQVMAKLVYRTILQQKYEQIFFINGALNVAYFQQYQIYVQDYNGRPVLNQLGSKELYNLVDKIISKWTVEKTGLVNFLIHYPDVIRTSVDLYGYLFRHLLELQTKINENQVMVFKNPIEDYDIVAKQKLIELLTIQNKKLSRSAVPKQSLKAIVRLIEVNKDEKVLALSLKILLNNINLQQERSIFQEVVSAVKETKCLALLPFRTILYKLKYINEQFLPNPEDLYKYIRGDEWIDWLEIYLSESRSQTLELQANQPEFLIKSLTSISGELLIKRLLQTKKGIHKFFNLLREQNMQSLCYKFLEACLYSEQSIREIDQFYFKKVHFNYEYQQVVEYIVNFNEHIGKDLMNSDAVLAVLPSKISLLTKILQIDIEKVIELEKYIFNQEYNKSKKFKPNTEVPERREGQKLVHLFIDLINIYSIKRWTTQLNISRIFNILTELLKNKKTETLTLAVMRVNKPSFNFIAAHLDSQTITSISDMLDQVLSANYLYDLIIDYDINRDVSLRLQKLYPFRYNDKQYHRLKNSEVRYEDSMSIYWIGQLVKIVYRQKFNPYLFEKLLSKLYIIPFELESESDFEESLIEKGLKRYKQNYNKIPPIFQMILGAVNNYNIWQEINKVLQFKITRSEGNLVLKNNFLKSNSSPQIYQALFYTLRLLRTLLKLNQILLTYQDKNPENFIIKSLSSIKVLSKIQLNNIVSNNLAKNNFLLSILANIQPDQCVQNDSIRDITWEAEQEEEDLSPHLCIFEFMRKNKDSIDFELVNDFVKTPNNKYCENDDNATTVTLQILVSLLRLYPDYNIEQTLLNAASLTDQEKLKLKSDTLDKLQSVLIGYATGDMSPYIQHKVLRFLYSLKYDAGKNRLNLGFADRVFAEYMRAVKPSGRDSRINQLLTRYFLRDLEEKRDKCELYLNPVLQCVISNLEFRDSDMRENAVIKDPRDIGGLISRYYKKYFSVMNLNQMERIIEERAIIEIAEQLESLQNIIKIIVIQLMRRKGGHGLLGCITLLNSLIANNQLLLIEHDMPLEYKSGLKCSVEQLELRRDEPRLFLRDPLQLYLTEIRQSNKKQQIQTYQKNNVVHWFLSVVGSVSSTISNYTKFTLTINKNLYSNNPIQYNIERQDLSKIELFCYLSFGKNLFSAVEMFGKTEADAISIVELMGESVVTRLSSIKQSEGHLFKESKSIRDGLEIIGLCLEWLKSRKSTGELHTLSLIRMINRHYEFLLPDPTGFLSSESIKIILSCLTVDSSNLSDKFKHSIHQSIYHLLYKYYANIKELAQNEYSSKISTLVQEAVPVLLVIPPERGETIVLEILVNIWAEEFNYQYYFNESRLILELCEIYPEEMVKFKPLSRCSIAQTANTIPNRYEDRQRKSESICWLWMLKVATALTNHPQSILIINEIDQFFKKYKQRIVDVITNTEEKITKGYIEELEAVLELLITMFSHELWLNFNRPYLEEITYILSQKTIKFFVGLAQGKIRPTVNSNNDKALCEIRPIRDSEDLADAQENNNVSHENIFQVEMRVKLIYCLRNYCVLMVKSFKSSLYVEKYFESSVFDNNRYLSAFWDNFNKNVICLFNYAVRQIKYWGGMKNLEETIRLMNNCYNAPHTFVQNGYLTTIIEIPRDETELLTEVYMLNYLVTELAAVHYLKEKLYINKYNNLIVSHLQNFGRRIKQHAKTIQLESKKLFPVASQPIKQSHFDALLQIVDNRSLK